MISELHWGDTECVRCVPIIVYFASDVVCKRVITSHFAMTDAALDTTRSMVNSKTKVLYQLPKDIFTSHAQNGVKDLL